MNKILEENEKKIEDIIDQKRLHLNYIWSNKITQEEINQPKQYDSIEDNTKLTKIILNSIKKLNFKIIEIMDEILNKNIYFKILEIRVNRLILFSSALIQKLKYLNVAKIRTFKLENEYIDSLNKIKQTFRNMKKLVGEKELSIKLFEIYDQLSEQIENLNTELY
jgi:hypothetical protein